MSALAARLPVPRTAKQAAIVFVIALVVVHVVVLPPFHSSLYGPLSFATHGGDTARYTSAAEAIRDGELPSSYQLLSSGYVLLIAASRTLGLGDDGAIVVQLVVALAAAVALFDLGRRALGPLAGVLAGLLYVANPFAARWRHFVLTDSLYESLVVLTVWAGVRAAHRERHGAVVLALVAAGTTVVRPNGILVGAVVAAYVVISRAGVRSRATAVVAGIGVLGAVFALTSVRAATADEVYNFPTELRRGQVVSDFGGHPDGLRIDMPATDDRGERNIDLLVFGLQHPVDTARVLGTRLFYELSQIRPGSSTAYNVVLPAGLVVLYALAIVGLVRARDRHLARLIALVTASQLATIAFAVADGDGRYVLWVLPIIGVLSATGAVSLFEADRSRR